VQFRISDLVVSKLRPKTAVAVATTCACCETVQTCKSCTKTSPPSTCTPPSQRCGGTMIVSRGTFKMLQNQLETVLGEFYAAAGMSKRRGSRKAKKSARKKKRA
jgi:hypothetical protein